MNILHLVLGCKNQYYEKIEETARNTWMKMCPENIKTIFMYGNSSEIYWDNNDSFYVNRPEGHEYNICLYKTLMAFKVFIESDFDYIYRTNNTGYFDLKMTSSFLEDKPRDNFYCGNSQLFQKSENTPYAPNRGINYASGASFFLSRDIVEKIIDDEEIIYSYGFPGWCDDVSIGKYITEHLKIDIDKSPKRLHVNLKEDQLLYGEINKKIDKNLDMSQYYYRIVEDSIENKTKSIKKIHTLKKQYYKENS